MVTLSKISFEFAKPIGKACIFMCITLVFFLYSMPCGLCDHVCVQPTFPICWQSFLIKMLLHATMSYYQASLYIYKYILFYKDVSLSSPVSLPSQNKYFSFSVFTTCPKNADCLRVPVIILCWLLSRCIHYVFSA